MAFRQGIKPTTKKLAKQFRSIQRRIHCKRSQQIIRAGVCDVGKQSRLCLQGHYRATLTLLGELAQLYVMWVLGLDCGLVAANVVPVAINPVSTDTLVAVNLFRRKGLIAGRARSYCEPLHLELGAFSTITESRILSPRRDVWADHDRQTP